MADQPTASQMIQMIAAALAENERAREALKQTPRKPSWKIPPITTEPVPFHDSDGHIQGTTTRTRGGFPSATIPPHKFPLVLAPEFWLALLAPDVVLAGLQAMQDNINLTGMDGMRWKDRESFEAGQQLLVDLIRQYQNLV